MVGGLAYIDTSAFLKLVATEDHSHAMVAWSTEHDVRFSSSDLLRTEAQRAVRNESLEVIEAVRQRLNLVHCLQITRAVCDAAAEVPPNVLRTLDAIHIATALALAPEVDTVVSYDRRMAQAAAAVGLTPVSPGQD